MRAAKFEAKRRTSRFMSLYLLCTCVPSLWICERWRYPGWFRWLCYSPWCRRWVFSAWGSSCPSWRTWPRTWGWGGWLRWRGRTLSGGRQVWSLSRFVSTFSQLPRVHVSQPSQATPTGALVVKTKLSTYVLTIKPLILVLSRVFQIPRDNWEKCAEGLNFSLILVFSATGGKKAWPTGNK